MIGLLKRGDLTDKSIMFALDLQQGKSISGSESTHPPILFVSCRGVCYEEGMLPAPVRGRQHRCTVNTGS